MPFQLLTTRAAESQWTQVAEYRPGRTSLWLEYLPGDAIFSPNTNLPMVELLTGQIVPAGIFYLNKWHDGDINFRLTLADGDLVEQAWYVWPLPGSVPLVAPSVTTFNANGVFAVPAGITQVTLKCRGQGGGAFDSDNVLGQTSGGGGGAYSEVNVVAIPPGSTFTIQCSAGHGPNPVAQPVDSWASLTGIAPTTILEGCLAKSGRNGGAPGVVAGGSGGSPATSIGNIRNAGGAGGDVAAFFPGMGGSGGGGGGGATSGVNGTNGSNGLGGMQTTTPGGVVNGGTGGASDGISTANGTASTFGGAGGCGVTGPGATGVAAALGPAEVSITYTQPGSYVVTTIETFILQPQPIPDEADTEANLGTINVPLPRLSQQGKLHLDNLLDKIQEVNANVLQDSSEYD
jgi:hypothetical protein